MKNWCKVNSHTLLLSSTSLDDQHYPLKLKRCGSRKASLLINSRDHHGNQCFWSLHLQAMVDWKVLVPGGRNGGGVKFSTRNPLHYLKLWLLPLTGSSSQSTNRKRMFLKITSREGCRYITGTGRSLSEIQRLCQAIPGAAITGDKECAIVATIAKKGTVTKS